MDPVPTFSTRHAVREAVRGMPPGYFALVMATGIVSIATKDRGIDALSGALLWLGILEYATLVVLYVWRAVAFLPAVRADLADPSHAFAYFTFVAATDVLGARLASNSHQGSGSAIVLLCVGGSTWVVLGYLIPWTAVVGHARRPLLHFANGTWFIWAVASQSVAVLAASLEPSVSSGRRELALMAVFAWSVGTFLYAAAGIFVAARLLIYPVRPKDLTPPYWVAMGATAITVVAGARIAGMADAPMVSATRGLVAGASVLFWAFGTWLIPPLIAAGVWRHIVHRVPLRYDASLWSMVFPLGMYAVGGRYLGQVDRLPVVELIGNGATWVALTVWAITAVAMMGRFLSIMARPRSGR
ncbi:MAG: tellurite resistance/C4-dicarboxylate transporter family protein [Allobranchiibius sp.]